MPGTHKTFCRICQALCGIDVEIDAGRVLSVRGDFAHPMSRGYTCEKGRQLGAHLHNPERLRSCLERRTDGTFAPIASEAALDAIGARLRLILETHGPRAIATYSGTAAYMNGTAIGITRAFHEAIGSPMRFTTITLDQPGKIIAIMRHGLWAGGGHSFESANVVILIGTNPLVSAFHVHGGPPGFHPGDIRRAQRERGLRVIVVDPRRTETAELADLHLAIQPGEDATLLAGMIRLILAEELHDRAFCDAHVAGLDELRDAVAAFTEDYVARRTGLAAELIAEAARLFARGPRGVATAGTGPNMSLHPTLTEHLVLCLDTLCGRWNREGERVNVPSLLTPDFPRPAQAFPPSLLPPELNPEANRERSRLRQLRQINQEMPTPALADEILEPGEGQVRALIVTGGNPLAACADPVRLARALESLDLLVCVDIALTPTCRRAHHVLAARHMLQRADVAAYQDMLYERPFAQYTDALVAPDGDLLDEWYVFAALAQRMGKKLVLPGGELDLGAKPTTLDVLELLYPQSKVPMRTLARYEGGHVFDDIDIRVTAPIPGLEGRLCVAPEGIADELHALRAEPVPEPGRFGRDGRFTHLLISRRMKHVNNSLCHDLPRSKGRANPAFVNPGDLASLGAVPGELVEIESDHARVVAVVEADDGLQPGVVSMAHAFGGDPAAPGDPRTQGTPVNVLVATDRDFDPWVGMPRQSAIPVRLRRIS
ncbi:MAG: molybdopterin-dependent oxidoreductase [Gammaproteobacteria bacterium]|jgi:anaerobic selenocysteine-containing dehydrogenase|nr:molybdopterin-dependent oxidoreductase [Gammaproteobacteria bacterium]MBP6050478.1 molybdopterin-dependent oxidoreductase [Pseudomonadales bacterium]MBK6583603.1 molybdopterin-dependent oxidoreductase [Gammaproteobacteria bacterium]MBK7169891.1 molybdopterin-dependent oxidoreductase [Gammaproteobacteria bacterium]MBK7521941.1 molybdopterin-dependent oxidoreductase [Gammaproteobacteria bacterium]